MTHKVRLSSYDRDLLEELMDLADLDYTIKGGIHCDVEYRVKGSTSKFRKMLYILSKEGIRFESDLGTYQDF